jgi:hypothetical protein
MMSRMIWFDKINVNAKIFIQYTAKGNIIRPFPSSFVVRIDITHGGKYKQIGVTIFPRGKILAEYISKDGFISAKADIKFTGVPDLSKISIDHMSIPKYLKRILKTIMDNTIIYNDLHYLKNTRDGELPDVTQIIEIGAVVFKENEYSNDLGEVNIDEYFNINDEEEYKVSHNQFVVQTIDGELTAIEKIKGKEAYNPFDQEILNAIIPAKDEYDELIEFIKEVIKEGEVEFGDKNLVDLEGIV